MDEFFYCRLLTRSQNCTKKFGVERKRQEVHKYQMMMDKATKLQELSKIYGGKGKRDSNKNEKTSTRKVGRKEKLIEEEQEIDVLPDLATKSLEKERIGDERRIERRLSLPVIPIAPLKRNDTRGHVEVNGKVQIERKISLPIIKSDNCIVSQSLTLDKEMKGSYQERVTLDGSFDYQNSTSRDLRRDDQTTIGRNTLTSRRRSSVYHASVFTPGKVENKRSKMKPAELIELIKKIEKSRDWRIKKGKLGSKELLRHVARIVGKVALFGNYLREDLNLRYLLAILNDPDYNRRYEKCLTPEIETDEEKEIDILQDMYKDGSAAERSDSEASMSVHDEGEHNTDSDDSDTYVADTDELSSVLSDAVCFHIFYSFQIIHRKRNASINFY